VGLKTHEDEFSEFEPENKKRRGNCFANVCKYSISAFIVLVIIGYAFGLYNQIGDPKNTSFSMQPKNTMELDLNDPAQSIRVTVVQNISNSDLQTALYCDNYAKALKNDKEVQDSEL